MIGAADLRWIARGAAAGAGAMLAATIIAVLFVAAIAGDAGPGWRDHAALTGVLMTGVWCLAAAGAGAVGAWQAAEGGAPDRAAARLAGAMGPTALVVLASLTAASGDHPGAAVVAVEAVLEVAAAVAGAAALARRLEPDW